MRRKTQEEFEREVYNQVGNEYTVLGEYKNCKTHVLIRHDKCGHEWNVSPLGFIYKKSRCPNCFGNVKLTKEDFILRLNKKFGNELILLSEYNGLHELITVKNINCGCEWSCEAGSLLYKNNNLNCHVCKCKTKKKTPQQFTEEVYEIVKDEYTFLEEYVNTSSKLLVRHNTCKNEYYVSPRDFLSGKRCPKCSHRSYKKTTEEFKQEVFNLVGNEYEVIDEYKRTHEKLLMKHNKCGSEYYVTPSKFLTGRRCPICAESKGEQKIRYFLENNNINFETQYVFNNFITEYGNPYRFDFGIFDCDNLLCLIEYDGEFHYKVITNEKDLEIRKLYDKNKTDYCIKNNIPLIRIPYWEFDNIEEILTKILDKYNKLTQKIS